MRFCVKAFSVFFLVLFMWQLGLLCTGAFIQNQHQDNSELPFAQYAEGIDNSTIAEANDLPSNIITEEVLEEEIQAAETLEIPHFTFSKEHYTIYTRDKLNSCFNQLDLPPETI